MPRHLAFDATVRRVVPLLPAAVIERWARLVLRDRHVALCLHRVDAVPAGGVTSAPAGLSVPAAVLDDLLVRAARIGGGRRWLTLSFDDGYDDAVRYVHDRAVSHPEIDWRAFVCPDKALRHSGFRWDAGLDPFAPLPGDVEGLAGENGRAELLAAGAEAATALATVGELRALARDVPSAVGNHTNVHLPLAAMAPPLAEAELTRSTDAFEHLLGPCRSFAFPFGTPGVYWRPEHAAQLAARGVEEIWSVESRTFAAQDRVPGAVLPRFPVDGRDDAKTILALVAARATAERIRRRPRHPSSAGGDEAGPSLDAALRYTPGEALVHLGGPPPEQSSLAPVVLVAGASGHVETFRYLAAVLATRRPVYGLRAIGVLDGEVPAADVDDAVATGVDAVKQLGRPVQLVGYSLGGFLALRMAAVLGPADLLAGAVSLIDTYHPSLEVLPLGKRVRNAVRFARRHGPHRLGPWGARLAARYLDRLRRRPPVPPPWLDVLGFGDIGALGLVDLEAHHRERADGLIAMDAYDGPVRSVRSLELAPNLPDDAGIGRCTARPPSLAFVRGDHFSMLSPRFVHRLVSALEL